MRLIIFLMLPFFWLGAQSSDFKLTPNGFVEYVVYEQDSLTANQLYEKSKSFLTKGFNLYDSQIKSDIKDQIITVTINDSKVLGSGIMKSYPTRMSYDLQFRFKDGKLRVDIANLYMSNGSTNRNIVCSETSCLWKKKKGKTVVRNRICEDVINDANTYFNDLVNTFLLGMANGIEDDW